MGGTGHNTFFKVGEELFTSYHSLTDPVAGGGNRQLCYDRAGFHADGTPFVSGPTRAPQPVPLKDLGGYLDPKIGKSGVNHRLKKLSSIAAELRKQNAEDESQNT